MFTIKESLQSAWEKFKTHVEVSVLTTLLTIILGSLGGKDEKFNIILLLFGLIMIIVMLIIRIGYTKIFLRMHDGENPKFVDIFKEYKTFWRYLGVCILETLAVFGGLILLIIPGIFWAIRFSFASFIVVDTKMSPVKAMRESWAITKGKFWKLFGFYFVMGLLNFAGILLFGVGLLLTIPLTTLALIYIYRKLSAAKVGVINTASPQTV
jgi:uncharacterized membrane protein